MVKLIRFGVVNNSVFCWPARDLSPPINTIPGQTFIRLFFFIDDQRIPGNWRERYLLISQYLRRIGVGCFKYCNRSCQ